jgi:hypothetical protein
MFCIEVHSETKLGRVRDIYSQLTLVQKLKVAGTFFVTTVAIQFNRVACALT